MNNSLPTPEWLKKWRPKLRGAAALNPLHPRVEPILTGAAAMRPRLAITANSTKHKSKVHASEYLRDMGIQEQIDGRAKELFNSVYIDPRRYTDTELPKIKRACILCNYIIEKDASMRNAKGFTILW